MPRAVSHAVVARRALMAVVVVMLLILIGTVSHALYIKIVHPSEKWVTASHGRPIALALGLGLAAGVVEAVFSYTGLREKSCAGQFAL